MNQTKKVVVRRFRLSLQSPATPHHSHSLPLPTPCILIVTHSYSSPSSSSSSLPLGRHSHPQCRYLSTFTNAPKDQWYIHKPKMEFPNEVSRENYERYKAAEERARLIYNQRLYADMAGVKHDDPTAYTRVQIRNWLTAALLVSFVGGVYWYSTRRIITADDTFNSQEMAIIQREVEEEIEAQNQEIEEERRSGIVRAAPAPVAKLQTSSITPTPNRTSSVRPQPPLPLSNPPQPASYQQQQPQALRRVVYDETDEQLHLLPGTRHE